MALNTGSQRRTTKVLSTQVVAVCLNGPVSASSKLLISKNIEKYNIIFYNSVLFRNSFSCGSKQVFSQGPIFRYIV